MQLLDIQVDATGWLMLRSTRLISGFAARSYLSGEIALTRQAGLLKSFA